MVASFPGPAQQNEANQVVHLTLNEAYMDSLLPARQVVHLMRLYGLTGVFYDPGQMVHEVLEQCVVCVWELTQCLS